MIKQGKENSVGVGGCESLSGGVCGVVGVTRMSRLDGAICGVDG